MFFLRKLRGRCFLLCMKWGGGHGTHSLGGGGGVMPPDPPSISHLYGARFGYR